MVMSIIRTRKSAPAKMTCALCNGFQGRWSIASMLADPSPRHMNRHHIVPSFTWNELEVFASSCYCCQVLVSGCLGCFQQHGIQVSDILRGILSFYYPSTNYDTEKQDASKNLIFLLNNGRRFEIQFFCTDDDDCPIPDSWDYIPVSKRTSPRTDSDQAMVTIKSWISACIVTHFTPESFCNTPDNPQLPTRVVDVGLDDGVVKLLEPKGARSKYICLSHCWGLAQIITTTKSNLVQHKKAIPWNLLSKTFRDAISLTRSLGFKYIWIDSLCIIQDDARDWDVESAQMASIYTNGHLTIAATRSPNGAGGLYCQTPDFEVAGTTPDKKAEPYRLFFRERIDHHIDMDVVIPDAGDAATGNPTAIHYPLLTRAWVYQERMLSTRILHFGRYELFFECRSGVHCECDGIEFNGSSPETPIPLFKIEHAEALQDYVSDWAEQFSDQVVYQGASLWRTMVSCYTALLLTKSKDRLPAISGIAKDLAARRKSRYLAGLWEETLNDDLLWIVPSRSWYKKARPHPRNAPTWSWASVETYIHYWDGVLFTSLEEEKGELRERLPYTHFSTIKKCEITWSAVDEFGTIAGGFLTISGLVVEGVLEREVELLQGEGESIVHYVSLPSRYLRLEMKADYLLDLDGPGQTRPGAKVLCMRMSAMQEGSTDHLISLVLKDSSETRGCFERIGIVVLAKKPPPIDPFGELFQKAGEQTVTIV
ncbi:hypothetical protein PAAG_03977 [Paracoccidioides lutzii Pb01]|uniref:Heterokaryon incompatibility domain-containing protein n=1 Tax=Paracoccidioides lutzii (strain ATCC MYA-826 / Pb01) TaxID=502779 RepID=C1GZN3_PARBA|nr:hypothetical protein PAAG_03977 [Paracoccidioides lutzii Pb01]EEH42056.2 hypothetical protein PAAG_03977 [Paracoccidioides lutzii Pb01]